jgi:chromosome segregation ATPase
MSNSSVTPVDVDFDALNQKLIRLEGEVSELRPLRSEVSELKGEVSELKGEISELKRQGKDLEKVIRANVSIHGVRDG